MIEASAHTPRLISVTSQKGGVGKTTLTLHLVHRAVELGYRTLLVDLDTQANATTALTRDFSYLATRGGAANLFAATAAETLRPIHVSPNLHLLHGHQYLDAVDAQIQPAPVVASLKPLLLSLPYDRILIDTPPGMSQRQLASLLVADLVLIPLEPGSFGVAGLTLTLSTVRQARHLNPSLQYRAVVNLLRPGKAQRRRLDEIRRHVALREPAFTFRSAVSEAIDEGIPVWRHRRADRALRQLWLDFASEVVQ